MEYRLRKNHGNNGIYGRFSNFFGTSCLDHVALSLRSGHITGGHAASDLAGISPKLFASLTTSHVRQPLYKIPNPPL
jgi:hypothetical protein